MNYELLNAAWEHVRQQWPEANPKFGTILGSGWGHTVESFEIKDKISYESIPGINKTGVAGHAGNLVLAESAGVETLLFQGRRHYYEGEGWTPIAIPLYIMKKFGVTDVVLTNAAGGIREDLNPGVFMLIRDHINFLGDNPLIGSHNAIWGDRFIDQSTVYNKDLCAAAEKAAATLEEDLRSGTYLITSGPFYESPAEIRAFSTLGADAVGMSTVPEVQLASAAGLRVMAISCITNKAAGLQDNLSHEEVIETTEEAIPRMKQLFAQMWKEFANA